MARKVPILIAVVIFLAVAYFSISSVEPDVYKDTKGNVIVKGSDLWNQTSYKITKREGKPDEWYLKFEGGYGRTDEELGNKRYLIRFKKHVENIAYAEAAVHILSASFALAGFLAYLYRKSMTPKSMQLFIAIIFLAVGATYYLASTSIIQMDSRTNQITRDVFDHESQGHGD